MKIPMKIPLLSEQRIRQFWAKVALTADDQKCWEWQAAKKGVTKLWSYGMFALNKRPYLAHRISYMGVQNGYCKLSEQNVRDIRRQYANGGVTQSTLGIAFGVGQTVISSIVLRKRWSHI